MIKFRCIVSILFLGSMYLQAQESTAKILTIEGKYVYDQSYYKFNELSSVFETKPEAFKIYKRAVDTKVAANVTGGFTIALILIGAITIDEAEEEDIYSQIIGSLLIFGAIIPGIIGISLKVASKKKERKAINIFNGSSAALALQPSSQLFKIGVTPHGIGLVYEF